MVCCASGASAAGAPGASASRRVPVGPPAAWVERIQFDASTPTPPGSSEDGSAPLLIETQEDVATGATYFHYVRRLQGAAAVSANSELSFSWDPAYQTLSLHDVALTRAGVRRNVLRPERIRVLERERDLEAKLLDGRLTAMLVLDDVRAGDVLEYAFTRTGRNPVFGPRWTTSFLAGATVPVARIRRRVVVPPGRRIEVRRYAGAAAPVETPGARGTELLWDLRGVAPTVVDAHLPRGYEVVPRVQLSEWSAWKDVADWGTGLFAAAASGVPADVVSSVRAAGPGAAEATLAALRFVQNEVRYLGIEMGASSHAPAPAGEVLARRFGDCKDKSALLVAVLRAVGVEADPALVSTDDGEGLSGFLPAPDVFDHVIVRARVGKDVFWLDPTMRQRRGALSDLVWPDVGRALVLDGKSDALVEVPRVPARLARKSVRNLFRIPSRGPATLDVTTTAYGWEADAVREDWAESRPEDLARSTLEFYTRRYPGIRATKPPELRDDAPDGSVAILEHYEVESLFRGNPPEADFYPQEIRDRVVQIASTGRKTPYALPFPSEIVETTEISFPEDWYVEPVSGSVKNAWVDYSVTSAARPKGVVLTWQLRSRAPVVAAADVARYAHDTRSLLDAVGFVLPWGGDVRPRTRLQRVNWPVIAATLLSLVVLGLAVVKVTGGPARVAPPPTPEDAPYEGLGGWLVLVGIGIVLRPIVLVASVVVQQKGLFDLEVWETYTTPGQHHALPALVLAELGVNLLQIALAVAVLVAYFGRKRRFVPLFAAQLILSPLVGFGDAAAVQAVGLKADPKDVSQAGAMVLPAMIWLAYLVRSRRVRATFTR